MGGRGTKPAKCWALPGPIRRFGVTCAAAALRLLLELRLPSNVAVITAFSAMCANGRNIYSDPSTWTGDASRARKSVTLEVT